MLWLFNIGVAAAIRKLFFFTVLIESPKVFSSIKNIV